MRSDSIDKGPQESEKLYRMLFDYSMDGIILVDPRDGGKVLSANQAACRMLGWTEEELIGKGREVMFDLEDPALSSLLEKRARSGSVRAQLTYRRKDGTTFPGEVSTAFFTDDNGEPRAVAIIRDITERKRAEEALRESETRFRTMFEAHGAPMLLIEPDSGQIIDANDAAVRFYEYSREQLRAMRIDEINQLPPEEVTAERYKAVERGRNVFIFRHRLASADIRWVEVYSSPVTIKGQPILFSIIHDITERKQAEEALRESEERYRTLFTNMTEGFGLVEVIYDRDGKPYDYRYLELNPAFELILGVKREQILGKSILEIFPNVNPIAIEKYGEVAVSGKPVHFEISSQITHRYLDIYAFSPEKGKLALILRDITERKRIEKELQESKERFAVAFRTIPDALVISDVTTGLIVDVNDAWTRHWGYSREESLGRRSAELGIYVNFADRERCMQILGKGGLLPEFDIELRTKKGNLLQAVIHTEVLKLHGGQLMLTVIRDITRRKETEAKLKETLDNLDKLVKERTLELQIAYDSLKESERGLAEAQKMAHLGNWEWDIATDKVYWSDEIYRILGFKPQEFEVTYKLLLNYVHPDDRDYVENAVKRALSGEHYSIEIRMISAEGEERIVHTQGEVIFDEKNTPIGMRGTAQDITERKKAEEALAKMEKIRIKEIHHRIKNNLQVISSLLDLQSEAFSHLEVCKVPEVIEAFTESQNRVVSMALIHEELYKGEKIDTLDFSAYLKKLTEDLFSSYNLRDKDISFKLDLEQVDLGMDTAIPLGIIVNELVSNSFKHAFPARREGEIRINLHRIGMTAAERDISDLDKDCMEEKNGFQYKLEVLDNGKGMPEEFDIENSASLGLQLVNLLVQQIDGCVEVKNGQGTEFTIWFNSIET